MGRPSYRAIRPLVEPLMPATREVRFAPGEIGVNEKTGRHMATGHFVWKGRLGPLDLILGEDTFAPTTISTLVAEAMDVVEGEVVVDGGTGTGVLAIIGAKLGASRVL